MTAVGITRKLGNDLDAKTAFEDGFSHCVTVCLCVFGEAASHFYGIFHVVMKMNFVQILLIPQGVSVAVPIYTNALLHPLSFFDLCT